MIRLSVAQIRVSFHLLRHFGKRLVSMLYLLDTNTCVAAMRNHPLVVQRMSSQSPGDCAISAVTSYELYTGVEKCADPPKERSKISLLLTAVRELSFDSHAARQAGQIRALLESRGQMIGPYDVLLAGQALANGLILVTNNAYEFSRVPGLQWEDWLT
jgi:tRNA(fMet)-specific endonuclease VapC